MVSVLANFKLFSGKVWLLTVGGIIGAVMWEVIELTVNPVFYPEPSLNMLQDVIMNIVGIVIFHVVYYFTRIRPRTAPATLIQI